MKPVPDDIPKPIATKPIKFLDQFREFMRNFEQTLSKYHSPQASYLSLK
ncbi:MAG: hypothetical protein V3T17_12000 [Pseudomonadales bacterium]